MRLRGDRDPLDAGEDWAQDEVGDGPAQGRHDIVHLGAHLLDTHENEAGCNRSTEGTQGAQSLHKLAVARSRGIRERVLHYDNPCEGYESGQPVVLGYPLFQVEPCKNCSEDWASPIY